MIFRNNKYTASNVFTCLILFLWMQMQWTIVVESYEFDCTKGCSLSPLLNGIAVCGVDDITYENICLAICQKVQIKKAGPCGVRFWNVTQNDRSGFVPIEIITRFASAGFKMTRRLNTTLFNRTLVREEPILNETDGTTGTINQVVRITNEGYEYYTDINVTLPGSDGKTYGPQPPKSTRRSLRDRILTVIGEDTRTRVNPTTGFPNS